VCSSDLVIGEGDGRIFPKRSSARPGESLYASGPLGLARAGLMCLEKGWSGYPGLVNRFKRPSARFDAALILKEHGVEAVMDISDGLAGDAGHMARESDITVELNIEKNTIDPELLEFCRASDNKAENMVLSGGEDYELLFSCEPSVFSKISKHLPEAFKVGTCHPFSGDRIRGVPPECRSYVHGSAKG
jgi:thiamine-monophosphate kinase